ncbi:DNA repair protein RecO [Conexibacter woesei]|uniref:DNA repair protein RecO n=1 Tax=Conexibacter woesei (strain DSM 14684 / CCUG 47730 / CIP 108061 / JCM 11494 / NBRC 100937 / ID131577) TaxID=469383 RepID=D3FD10_CONWI|nr:DNA repair protein RecO [Conexibacter woesei]ADB51522.1 DNA repair protein RecO [Conexibacter woesei DSM 14684]
MASRSLRTEAIVLRSIRFGEADRILHLYTPDHGRVGAIAKGARKTRSRFGARLEPFFHLRVNLHLSRGDLHTVTSADTIDPHGPLRERACSLDAASRACDAVTRLFETDDPSPAVFHLLANELRLLDGDERHSGQAAQLAFRLKLLVAGGFTPQLASCASCGESDHLSGFSGSAGGVVCSACEASAFPLSEEAYTFLVEALGRPLADAPDASLRALRQAERAITETAEHHAHVHLRSLARQPRGAPMT